MTTKLKLVTLCFFLFFSLLGIVIFFIGNVETSFISTITSPQIINRFFFIILSVVLFVVLSKLPILSMLKFSVILLMVGYTVAIFSLFLSYNGNFRFNNIYIPVEHILSFTVINFLTNTISLEKQRSIDVVIYSLISSTSVLLLFLNQKFAFAIILFLTLFIISFSYSFLFALKNLFLFVLIITSFFLVVVLRTDFIKTFSDGISLNPEFMFFSQDVNTVISLNKRQLLTTITSLHSFEKLMLLKYGFTLFFLISLGVLILAFFSMFCIKNYKDDITINKTDVHKTYAFTLFLILWMLMYLSSILYLNPLFLCNMPFFTFSNIEYLMLSLMIVCIIPHTNKKLAKKSEKDDE